MFKDLPPNYKHMGRQAVPERRVRGLFQEMQASCDACTCHIHFPDVLLIMALDPKQTLPSLQNLEAASPACKCQNLARGSIVKTGMVLRESGGRSSSSRGRQNAFSSPLIERYSLLLNYPAKSRCSYMRS